MEGLVARWYAKNTRKDAREYQQLAKDVVADLEQGSRILELACGPAYLAIEMARLGTYQITGLDLSKTFVEIARKNAADAGVEIEFRQGDAADMPFRDETFDFVVCRAAFKNFAAPLRALEETYRVLKSNGRALIVDLRRDASGDAIDEYIKNMGLGRIDSFLTRWIFRTKLIRHAYTNAELEEYIAQSPFKKYRIQEKPISMDVWLEK